VRHPLLILARGSTRGEKRKEEKRENTRRACGRPRPCRVQSPVTNSRRKEEREKKGEKKKKRPQKGVGGARPSAPIYFKFHYGSCRESAGFLGDDSRRGEGGKKKEKKKKGRRGDAILDVISAIGRRFSG